MKNIRDLEIGLCEMFEQVKSDPRRCAQAKEVANVAGKLINAQKISMEYAAMHKSSVELPFMERSD